MAPSTPRIDPVSEFIRAFNERDLDAFVETLRGLGFSRVTESGDYIAGYMPPKELVAQLKDLQPTKH